MLYNTKEGTLKIGDAEVDYISFGKGSKPLIMIQGLNTRGIKGAGVSLAYMYRCFAKDFTVYLFDRRKNIAPDVTVRALARDVAAAMDALNIKRADILGVSQGGMMAQYLAIDRPDLVNRLVLAVTISRNNGTLKKVINDWVELTERGDMKTLVRDMAEKMYSEKYVRRYKPLMPLLTLLQKPKDKERFITLAKACLTCNAYGELEKISCPVFVIGGGKDEIVGGEASKEIADRLGCKVHIYENLGHAAYEEAKDFNKIVYDFLTES